MQRADATQPEPRSLQQLHDELVRRVGKEALSLRLEKQALQESKQVFQSKNPFNPDRIPCFFQTVRFFFQALGIYQRGYREFMDVQLVTNEIYFSSLPPELDGLRILQISDLHLDLEPALTTVIVNIIKDLDYDLALITGDYRDDTKGCISDCLEYMHRVCGALHEPVYGILGNHDPIELVPPLESMGLPILLNETVSYEKNGKRIYISGIDDPHFYKGDDFEKLRGTVPENAFSILLSHAPETHQQALHMGYDLVLAGHTHGGQICLPGGIVVMHNGDCPSYMLAGNWKYGDLKGYTSRGTGGCRLPLRFFCPPEITVHVLKHTKSEKL
mgnify:CR=1 FL=1